MKTIRSFLILMGALLLAAAAAQAEVPRHGMVAAGIRVGSLTGLDMKFWLGHDNALQLAVGSGPGDSAKVEAADVWHIYGLFHSDRADLESSLPIYFGIGGALQSGVVRPYGDVDAHFSVMGVAGISYLFETAPFDVFIELQPSVGLLPGNAFGIHTGLGGRYYF